MAQRSRADLLKFVTGGRAPSSRHLENDEEHLACIRQFWSGAGMLLFRSEEKEERYQFVVTCEGSCFRPAWKTQACHCFRLAVNVSTSGQRTRSSTFTTPSMDL